MSYILDANSYIQAKNFHYRMRFCPGFWDWLDHSYREGSISSISMVYKELSDYGDELSDWVKKRQPHFLSVDDAETQEFFAKVAKFVMDMPLPKTAEKMRFLAGADPWLVAKAATSGKAIVTHEVPVPANSQKIKIPNICNAFEVNYLSAYDLLDELNAEFIVKLPAT